MRAASSSRMVCLRLRTHLFSPGERWIALVSNENCRPLRLRGRDLRGRVLETLRLSPTNHLAHGSCRIEDPLPGLPHHEVGSTNRMSSSRHLLRGDSFCRGFRWLSSPLSRVARPRSFSLPLTRLVLGRPFGTTFDPVKLAAPDFLTSLQSKLLVSTTADRTSP